MTQENAGGGSARVEPTSDVIKTVVESYYSRGVAAADRSRDRAERGYTIASAIAAALVAAGVFTNLDERPRAVQILGLLALGVWLIAALLYIWVVSVPARTGTDPGWTDPGKFVSGVAEGVAEELVVLRRRLARALSATIVAILLTVAALAAATTVSGGSAPEAARLVLTAKADAALANVCTRQTGDLFAKVDPDALDDDVVTVTAPAGACNDQQTTLRLPRDSILAEERIVTFPGFPRESAGIGAGAS